MAASMDIPADKEAFNVLPKTQGGGPLGLGDPDDLSLRKVEREVMIPKMMKYRAHKEKCVEAVEEFSKCGKEQGLLLPFLCRKESNALNKCLEKWYTDEDFRAECTKTYLEERAEYRRTGVRKRFKKL